jgi:hypothetical protein
LVRAHPVRPHVHRQGDVALHVDRPKEHRQAAKDQQERLATQHAYPPLNCDLGGVLRLGRPCLTDTPQHDQAKQKGSERVADEQQQVIPARHQTGDYGRKRGAQVDGPVDVAIGAWPPLRRNQVGDRCADRRAVQVGEEALGQGEQGDERDRARQAQENHVGRGDQETQQQDGAAAQPVGQLAAHQGRGERTCAEQRDHQRRLADRDAALVGQVERQKGDDEAAQPVDERPQPQEPVRGRQAGGQAGQAKAKLGHVSTLLYPVIGDKGIEGLVGLGRSGGTRAQARKQDSSAAS